ncbi:MAG: hypothetical protein HY681_09345 [Chloroflexi bacterium]|nr:hypothetical protein [Chloroflexota bacterium]
MTSEGGPYVQVAAFCDYVLEDKQGSLSLIRLIDTLTHTERGPNAPRDMPSVPYALKLVVSVKSGRARGRTEVKVVPELPSGENKEPLAVTVHLEGEDRGQNVIFNINMTFTLEGLYWFNVYCDDVLLTRVPFRAKYMRAP